MRQTFAIAGFIILLLLSFIGGHEVCKRNTDAWQKDSVITIYDSTETVVRVPVPTAAKVIIDTLIIPANVDTAAILADYHTRRTYGHSYRDSSIAINFKPVVSRNRLDSINFTYKLIAPTQQHFYSQPPKHIISAGVELGYNRIAPRVEYSWNEAWTAGASYNLTDGPAKVQLSITRRLIGF